MPGTRFSSLYVTVLIGGTVTYMVAPSQLRPTCFFLISLSVLPAIIRLLFRCSAKDRVSWILLLVAITFLSAGSGIRVIPGCHRHAMALVCVSIGHVGLFISASGLLAHRGRQDPGGLIDIIVVSMGVGGLVWTCFLDPRMIHLGLSLGPRAAFLITVFTLTGVLGALIRFLVTDDKGSVALRFLACAYTCALLGNVIVTATVGLIINNRIPWVELPFLLAYVFLAVAVLHPSAVNISHPRVTPIDRLSGARLIFLGIAIAMGPVVGGVRQVLGFRADGLLVALSTIIIVPLFMTRMWILSQERERVQAALLHQVIHDDLTGLLNRAEVLARLDRALERERADPQGRHGVVVLFCDLDGFKKINDDLGHLVGDLLLKQVAHRLSSGLRPSDTLARYGGDEFLVMCETASPEESCARLCRHFRDALAAPCDLGGVSIVVDMSVGAVVSDRVADAAELVRRADNAMYEVKRLRRNSTHIMAPIV